MSQETFTLTVLPVSVSPSRGFHVSLHIGPTLEPDGGKSTTLGAVLAGTTDAVFPIFKDWPKYLRSARIELLNEAGKTIGAAALLDQMDDALWAKVFPSSTPVRVPVTDTFDERRWDTFAVKDVHDAARAINLISLAESPVDPAKPFGSQIGRAMLQEVMGDLADKLAGSEEGLRFIGDYLDGKGRNSRLYDESEFARQLDTFIQRYTNGNGAVKQGQSPTFQTLLAQLHQARRFYERPDLMAKYQEEPGNERGWQPEVPDPDFHERVAHLSDVPELLRKLGLVIDLNVTDLAALGKAQSLQARIVRASRVAPGRVLLPQALDPNQSMITPVIRSGDNLLAKPAGDDLLAGRLRLGDTQRYATMVVDADGSALKLDRFLWSVPRLVRLESYGEPANVAPPSLRAEGFTIARNGKLQAVQTQVQRARDHVAARNARKPVTLSAEDITRGYRIEVWDDTAAKWFGLHERLIDVQVKGAGLVFEGLRTTGQIGGSAVTEAPGVDNPNLKLHEAVFGWSGWSLSAPRPGPRIRHEDGREIVEDADSDPSGVTPVTIKPRVAPGTLPRLRYGRSYAFRAWSVDIAGNSPPHAPVVGGIDPGTSPSPTKATDAQIRKQVAATLAQRNPVAASEPLQVMRAMLPKDEAALPAFMTDAVNTQAVAATAAASKARLTGVAPVDEAVEAVLMQRVAERAVIAPTRKQLIEQAMRPALTDAALDAPQDWSAESLHAAAALELNAGLVAVALPEFVDIAAQTVTPLTPFLRWEPVLPPVVVARHRFSEAESVHHLVIRSGVEPAADGAAPTLIAPAEYAAQMIAAHPQLSLDWRGTSERHLAAPKTVQATAELHGRFDAALGSADPAVRKRLLATALRDDGTLLDVDVIDLNDPAVRHPQPGISLQAGPSVTGPRHDLSTLVRGQELTPGEYVVHDVNQLVLPYLPDPMASGLTMRFPDAGANLPLPSLMNVEAMRTEYRGQWPMAKPYRLVLSSGDELDGRVDGNTIQIAVPPGEKLRVKLSSALRREELDLLGAWHALPAATKSNDLLAEAAADGWLWALTPPETLTLVHAVPRPVAPAVPAMLQTLRGVGDTGALLVGIINCHAASTATLDAEARWIEHIDDISRDAPGTEDKQGVACSFAVAEHDDPVLLMTETTLEIPGLGVVPSHLARHELGDTRHRVIDYTFRATTRYQEYFPPALMADRDARSITGPTTRLSLPSTARPAAPVIHSVIPLFRWEEGTEPDQPFAQRRRRRAGLRIYLQRPWYSSGEGERLGILISSNEAAAMHVSQWGADPMWVQKGPEKRNGLLIEDLFSAAGLDHEPGTDPRVMTGTAKLAESGIEVSVLGYLPEYQPSRGMWFVDVAFVPQSAYWPFVRLAVARYQPDSLTGLELSQTVTCDFAQLTPERMATVSRPDENTVRIVVSGPIGLRARLGRGAAPDAQLAEQIRLNHRVLAKLERRDPAIDSDLGWEAVRITELAPAGIDDNAILAWLGQLDLIEPMAPARPGQDAQWRVTIEEWEGIEADPQPFDPAGPLPTAWRLTYADRLAL